MAFEFYKTQINNKQAAAYLADGEDVGKTVILHFQQYLAGAGRGTQVLVAANMGIIARNDTEYSYVTARLKSWGISLVLTSDATDRQIKDYSKKHHKELQYLESRGFKIKIYPLSLAPFFNRPESMSVPYGRNFDIFLGTQTKADLEVELLHELIHLEMQIEGYGFLYLSDEMEDPIGSALIRCALLDPVVDARIRVAGADPDKKLKSDAKNRITNNKVFLSLNVEESVLDYLMYSSSLPNGDVRNQYRKRFLSATKNRFSWLEPIINLLRTNPNKDQFNETLKLFIEHFGKEFRPLKMKVFDVQTFKFVEY